MPSFKVEKQTDMPPQDAYQKIKGVLENDSELKKLDPQYSCSFNDSDLKGEAKGSQFKAAMTVAKSGPGSTVEIAVDLPFHLGLVKGMVKKTLEKKMDKALS